MFVNVYKWYTFCILLVCIYKVVLYHSHVPPPPGGGGGGYFHICMHIGYVPHERPPFSALNFRSGAYNFHKLPKKSGPEHPHFTFLLLRILPFRRPSFSNILLVSGRPECQPDASWQFRRPAFSRSKRIKLGSEPRIFSLKTAQARSGVPRGGSSFFPRGGGGLTQRRCRASSTSRVAASRFFCYFEPP